MRRARVTAACLAAMTLILGCGACEGWHAAFQSSRDGGKLREASSEPYRPNRIDYQRFLARAQGEHAETGEPLVLEPNYLPFMAHRMPGREGAPNQLVLCRWSQDRMPLAVHVEAPKIADGLQKEFNPIAPEAYVEAVDRALATWEHALEGLVRFERVARGEQATIVVRLHGARAPESERGFAGLGRAAAMHDACRDLGPSSRAHVRNVGFELSTVDLYVADEVGLLNPEQVEGVALHEIGHALGMKRHSPVPVDMMFAVPTDRIYGSAGDPMMEELAIADLNSFISLYRLPNGSVIVDLPGEGEQVAASQPPPGPPVFAMAPYVGSRDGFEIRVPEGWIRVEGEHGLYTANGPIWDHDVSIEVFFWPHPTVEAYLERFGGALFAGSSLLHQAPIVVDGREGLQLVFHSPEEQLVKEFIFVEPGDGRVVVIFCEAKQESAQAWRPWFLATIDSLEFWSAPAEAATAGAR